MIDIKVYDKLNERLTPYGSLVRTLRMVSNTKIMEMSNYLNMTPHNLAEIEFGRKPITRAVITATHEFFQEKKIDVSELLLWQSAVGLYQEREK